MPVGIIIARFYKDEGGAWFRRHRAIQSLASILNILAFFVIVSYTEGRQGAHFQSSHQVIGLIIFILGVLQPLGGFLRPHKSEGESPSSLRRFWEFTHRWVGRAIVILSIFNINLGTSFLVNPVRFRVAWIVIVALLAVLYTFKEFQKLGRQNRKSKDNAKYVNV